MRGGIILPGTRYLSRAETERDQYINWLANKVTVYVGSDYSILIRCLWDIPFVWQLPDDQNRSADGNMLRAVYIQSHNVQHRDVVFPFEDGCTFLEFLIGLSMRINDIMYEPNEDKTHEYFWMMLGNMGLDHCTDGTYGKSWDDFLVNEVTGRIMSRNYDFNGIGGLFPLQNPVEDQKKVPIWYQMNAFLTENM